MTRQHFSPEYTAQAARVLRLLSHRTRLRIVLALAQGPATVSEVCDHLEISQSNASHHLAILRNTGLVRDEREGQFVVYRINVPAWTQVGDGFFDHLLQGQDSVMLQHFRISRLHEEESGRDG